MISISSTMPKSFVILIFLVFSIKADAQEMTEKKYPQGYFIYPVGAQAVALAANFGELRPDHFHMGLDCKTDRRENENVYAAADGYVARVKIEPFGFGRAIYINHPNGYTTLYAHLNAFFPELEAYVKAQQYKQQSWAVFLDIPKGMFNVKQRQFIAKSGNTGGSQGPHTHFEIREMKTDRNLNPLLFGLPIPDHVAPTVNFVSLYNRERSLYNQRPTTLPVVKTAGGYTTVTRLVTTSFDRVSFGIAASDQLSGSLDHNGIYSAEIFEDGKALCGFQLDNISYDDTRYVNANIDYKTKMSGGPYIQHLSRLPGNPVYPEGVYHDFANDGVIVFDDNDVHHIKIVVKDANHNTSVVSFDVQHTGALSHATAGNNEKGAGIEFEPNLRNIFDDNDVEVLTDDRAVYDSFEFKVAHVVGAHGADAFDIGSPLIPLHTYATIKIRPTYSIPAAEQDRMVIIRRYKEKKEVVKAKKEGEKYMAKFRSFGEFELAVDMEPPVITASFVNGANLAGRGSIAINVKDNNGEISKFKALLDGKWLRFTNDKAAAYIYVFDDMCSPGKHTLVITASDEAGNVSTKILNFTR